MKGDPEVLIPPAFFSAHLPFLKKLTEEQLRNTELYHSVIHIQEAFLGQFALHVLIILLTSAF